MTREGVSDLGLHKINDGFDEILEPARHAVCKPLAQTIAGKYHDYAQEYTENQGIDVQRPETGRLVGYRITFAYTIVG